MAPPRSSWEAALAHLRALPFLRALHFDPPGKTLHLSTPAGTHRLPVETTRSYLDQSLLNAILVRAPRSPLFVLARYVPMDLGHRLVEAGVSFADDAGNLHLRLGDSYNWTILGRRQPPPLPETVRTTPATLQLLFQLMTHPASSTWTVRDLALSSGVSKSKVAQLLHQLRLEGLLAAGDLFRPTPSTPETLVAGYGRILRPKLIVGRYRSPEPHPEALIDRLSGVRHALTGAPAVAALGHPYQAPELPLFLATPDPATLRHLRLLPDRTGPVLLLRAFGELVYWREISGRMVAPPWLIYSELLQSPDPRAREAAAYLLREFLS